MKKELYGLDKVCENAAKLTDMNLHSERLQYIAETLDYKRLINVFQGIKTIEYAIGYLPSHLVQFRYDMEQELYMAIEKQYGKEIMVQIKMS